MAELTTRRILAICKRHWELSSTHFTGSVLNSGELLELLLAAREVYRRRGGRGADFRFYRDGSTDYFAAQGNMPTARDQSLDGYAHRVASSISPAKFGIALNAAHRFHPALHERLRDFLSAVCDAVGVPIGPIDAAVFLGDYTATPFGVHSDTAGVFHFVVAGRRTVYLWEPEAWLNSKGGRLDFHSAASCATIVSAEAGEVVYWPSRLYHVVEPDGFSAAISVGCHLERSTRGDNVIARGVAVALSRQMDMTGVRTLRAGSSSRGLMLPRTLRTALNHLNADPREIAAAVAEAWIARLSAYGLEGVETIDTVRSGGAHTEPLTGLVYGDADHPIQYLPIGGGEMICGARGATFRCAASSSVKRLIAAVNSGRVYSVQQLLALGVRSSQQFEQGYLLELLDYWHEVGQLKSKASRTSTS